MSPWVISWGSGARSRGHLMAAGDEQRRAVLLREIVDRPHAVDHRLPSRMLEREHQIVGMDELLRLARADLDGLGQVELVRPAASQEKLVHDGQDVGLDGS